MDRQYVIIGLGYVGLDLAVSLSKSFKVIGYDKSSERIGQLKQAFDKNKIVDSARIKNSTVTFTDNFEDIKQANFYIVAVPTPVHYYELPDLQCLIDASVMLAKILKKDDIIVYESTVYPGTTEEVCIRLLEENSQMKCGKDFNVGYSPERISPNDKVHILSTITKVVGAQNQHTLDEMINTYQEICNSVYPVSSIKVAEASKILENTQRDVNIAFMNEFAKIMHAIEVDAHEVIDAAKTKWNFSHYKPGFVGGHCISVDPHYLVFKAKRHSVEPAMILTARRVNDAMTQFVINQLIKLLVRSKKDFKSVKLGILGVTYKENVPDIRNSLMLKLIKELDEYQISYVVHDPLADEERLLNRYNIKLYDFDDLTDLDVIILGVGHLYYFNQGLDNICAKIKKTGLFMDVPSLFANESKADYKSINFWNL